MSIGRFVRGLVLAILWMAVAATGVCGLIGIGTLGGGGGLVLGICIVVLAALLGAIWLIKKLTGPSQPPNP